MFRIFLFLFSFSFLFGVKIEIDSTWYWQLDKKVDLNHVADIYIIDLFDTNISTIKKLHDKNKTVIAYFSAGSYESWREDAKEFKKGDFGKKMSDWDEVWLDIRSKNVKRIMKNRIKLAKEKGFDGVEADNVDGYTNGTGFNLSYNDQLNFNKFLASYAHKLGLVIALKNNIDQVKDLESYFDFAINESCHVYNECEAYKKFTKANKAVFNAEYEYKDIKKLCQKSKNLGISTQVLTKALDGVILHDCK